MLDALFCVFSHPLDKRRIRNDIANVFVNECVPVAVSGSEGRGLYTSILQRTLAYPLTPAGRTPFSPSLRCRFSHIPVVGTLLGVRRQAADQRRATTHR